jgi:uncharacterized protein
VRDGTLTLVSSPALLAELADIHDPPPLETAVSRDPDDDELIALAVASQADLIISGDADLLSLGEHAGIPIVDPADAIARIDE